ncbi:PQQ-dependent sugar dehydrogenase [Allomuricauda sp. AC10]|uniref:PQQ-dependent sugar dehydrogenase n=2 Tax=Flavobacteriales TaxID=200644 RepID=UPI00234BE6CD|nr:PQQ-dependent sugar dehydrogenase [Muricauda sp. AC10]
MVGIGRTCSRNMLLCMLFFGAMACKNDQKPTNSDYSEQKQDIVQGAKLFEQQCTACHGFEQDGIGPNLAGITQVVNKNWIKRFLKSPKDVLNGDDDRGKMLKAKYVTMMPSFGHLHEKEVEALLAFLNTHEKKPDEQEDNGRNIIRNPIEARIALSNLSLNLNYVGQIPASHDTLPYTRINTLRAGPLGEFLYINDLRGILWKMGNGTPSVYLNMASYFPNFVSRTGLATGFGSFAFHPDFEENGLFYTSHTEKPKSAIADFPLPQKAKAKLQWVVTEWKCSNKNTLTFKGSMREIVRIEVKADSHGMQEIVFNPHSMPGDADYGKLYIGLGDGGSVQVGHPYIATHNGSAPWGGILRIDPLGRNSKNGNYSIPKDNPFVGRLGFLGELWAYGFRNPNRISWYDKNRILASDIGQANIEELNLVEPGAYHGWPFREGTFLFDPKGNFNHIYSVPEEQKTDTIVDPILQYDHDEGAAISGGFLIKDLETEKKYLFGDIPTGRIFLGNLKTGRIEELQLKINNTPTTLIEATKSNRADLKYGLGKLGEIYVFTKADGKVYRVQGIQ